MTPLGLHLREWRARRGMTQSQMAKAIGVSAAYLSALERGNRGVASFELLQRIITCLNIIWDDAEKLQEIAMLSNPKVVIDTHNLTADATELANRLSHTIKNMDDNQIEELLSHLKSQ